MPTYEKWNNDNTERLNTIKDPDQLKLSKMVGYKLVVMPVFNKLTHKLGGYKHSKDERSWHVVPLDGAEISKIEEANIETARLAGLNTELNNSEFKGLSLSGSLDLVDQNVSDPGINSICKKIIGALVSLHPHELK
jgi:hypothetical protein